MAGQTLPPRSLSLHEGRFNWVFLLWYIVSSILAILFLFYFNRLFASLVSHGIRAYTWHRYRVSIDFQALQFSLLAGRLFFKGLRYHGQNETVLIHDGYVTWRYWLRHVQELDCKRSNGGSKASASSGAKSKTANRGTTHERAEENGGNEKSRRLPCRVLVKSRGVEWFIYNRSPAHDAILQGMRRQEEMGYANASPSAHVPVEISKPDITTRHCASAVSFREESAPSLTEKNGEGEGDGQHDNATIASSSISIDSSARYSNSISSTLPIFLSILPVRIECNKGAIVMGNRNTRSILTAKFDSAAGNIDARASGPLDQYKQTFDFDFSHPVIELKLNRDYMESQVGEGSQRFTRSSGSSEQKPGWFGDVDHRRPFRNIWTSFWDYVPYHRGSIESVSHPRQKLGDAQTPRDDSAGVYGQNGWLGLTRYLDDDDDLIEQERWKAIEYGAFPTIVDSPEISVCICWDVPGLIPHAQSTRNPPPGFETDINGDAPPDWVIELKISGGTINYGPWADRQRADLQAIFFPALCKDAVPAAKLQPGQPRISTVQKVILEIDEQTTLRVPTREDSKDWKWKGQTVTSNTADAQQKKRKDYAKNDKGRKVGLSPEVRSFGWLDIKVLPDSTVNFTMDLMARSEGYRNHVGLDLKGVEMSSSVNHGLLWRSRSQVISCNLSNPLGWNALRQWQVDIKDDGLELFMLRDHMFLMTDLINDWLSGPPGEFHTFVPFEYSIALRFNAFKLFLNANDSNIINSPSDLDDNNFVVIGGQQLKADLVIPSKNFRPVRNQVTLEIEVVDGGVETRAPPRNTQHTFLNSSDVATFKTLKIGGSYSYFTTTSPNLTDILSLSVLGVAPKLDLYGSLVRYLMKIKDNYFGDDIHFHTLEEYQCQFNMDEPPAFGVPAPGQHSRLSNDLDVILDIAAENSCAIFPANLYSSERNIRLEIPSIAADLRITNYYMDLAAAFSPIAISYTSLTEFHQRGAEFYSSTQVFIDGLEIFGHRLFGLPPTEPTYVCNWDFDVGCIRGECSVEFVHCLSMALRCFALSFGDAENALPPSNLPSVHDVTFLRARVRPILLGLRIDQNAFLLSSQSVKIDYNDWASPQFLDRLHVLAPHLTLSVIDTKGVSMDTSFRESVINTHAYVKLTLELSKIARRPDFNADRHLQQNHITVHDSRTRRVPWLVLERHQPGTLGATTRPTKSRPPAMAFPSMPEPISTAANLTTDESSLMPAGGSSTGAFSRSSSLLSTATSGQGKFNRRDGGDISSRRRSRQARDPRYRSQKIDNQSTAERRASQDAICPLAQRDFHIDSVKQDHFAHSGFAFSGPYKNPYFPLLAVQPDISDVPISPMPLLSEAPVTDGNPSDVPRPRVSDQGTEQSSFMVTLGQGIQAMCTPQALLVVTQLLVRFQATDEVTLLDTLQLDAMTDVLSAEAKSTEGARISDFRIHVPWVGARFISVDNSSPSHTQRNERYDMVLEKLAVTGRFSQNISNITPSSPGSQSSFHLVLDKMICSARESRSNSTEDQAMISFTIREPMGWISYGTESAAGLQFQSLEIESAGTKINYISLLIQQTLVMFEGSAQRFREVEKERKSRLQLLVLLLTVEGKDVPDPPFLTRVSNVLRSASQHLRTSDCWKMMSRLRYIHHCLPAHARDKIHAQCVHKLASCPEDAGNRVIAGFEHWRRWDLKDVRSNLLLQKVFGQSLNPPVRGLQTPVPTKATLRAGKIKIVVGPGPSQNEVTVEELIIGVALHQPNIPQDVSSVLQQPSPSRSTIQVYYAQAAVHLHWALLELIEDLMETMQASQVSHRKDTSSLEASTRLIHQDSCLHLTVSSDVSVVTLNTPNLRAMSLCQDLRIVSIFLEKGADSETSLFSVLVDADIATSEIHSRSTKLASYKLQRPRLFASKGGTMGRAGGKSWKIAGSSKNSSFWVLANPLEIIEIADSVLKDEVAHIKAWVNSIQLASVPVQLPVATQHPVGLFGAHVALSLDSYLISLTVLPSLIYQIRGDGARTSFRATPRGTCDTVVDIHFKEHSHVFKSSMDNALNDLSTLDMPPITTRLSINLGPSQRSVVFKALIESVVFDASALHAILTTVNQPEMISLAENIAEGASSVQNRYRQIFGVTDSRNEALPSEPTIYSYSAHVILSSLAVQAKTSDALSNAPRGQLQVKMDRIRLKTTNRDRGYGATLKLPEAEVEIESIRLKLLRFDNDGVHACGDVAIGAVLRSTSEPHDQAELVRAYQIQSNSLQINLYTDTASVLVAIIASLQDTLKTIDLSHEVQGLRKLGHARLRRNDARLDNARKDERHGNAGGAALFSSMYSLKMTNVCVAWIIGRSVPISPDREPENLILSFAKIELSTKKYNAARLLIQDLQLQMVPHSKSPNFRSQNSALLPELVFNVAYVSTEQGRRLAFQAAGKSLDIWLTSHFILPASDLRRSIALSIQQVRTATSDWTESPAIDGGQRQALFSEKNLASLLVDADFAGAAVFVRGRSLIDSHLLAPDVPRGVRLPQHGRYNQFTPDNANNSSTTLRAPGIAFKVAYRNGGPFDQSINAEMKIDASSNILHPTVVPLIMEISSSIRDVVEDSGEQEQATRPSLPQPKFLGDERLRGADPVVIFGNCKLNLGLRICRQEFSLSCQPIARVAATARFEEIYIAVNTVQSNEHGRFFTMSAAFNKLHASVQHVYSRESTGNFEVESIVVSLMNSKHVSTANGISAILNISPMKAQVNAKQSQDFLLFREIWVPPEIRRSSTAAAPVTASESQAFIVQRYQHIAAAGAFPWNAMVSIAELDVQLDLGQSLGKSVLNITRFWVSSEKTSDWEQNLCIGFNKMAINSTGRMSGFVELQNLKVRTSIQWPMVGKAHNQTPLVQASVAFDELRVKASFDYQAFFIADITNFEFMMYNVRDLNIGRDRLVGVLDGEEVQVYWTTTSASQAIALYQAFQRLYQEKLSAYETSLRDIEKFLRRKSSITPLAIRAAVNRQERPTGETTKSPLRLQTNVVVAFKSINIGAFPSTFVDSQIFKLEAFETSARFAVVLEHEKIHSTLGMTLGQLRVALANVTGSNLPKTLGEISIKEVVASAKNSRGGTILKVPKLVASMETWQNPESTHIDYIFKSSFQGKVDVGWNYSRISYIRGMWTIHARSLAQRLGKPLPKSAVQITGGARFEGEGESPRPGEDEQEKITAVVNVPQSRYHYTALQPPIIETPQLRDMGEATPPLEWIGLHRERLPNLTHQIIIVTLLEVAKEVGDAYSKILGSS